MNNQDDFLDDAADGDLKFLLNRSASVILKSEDPDEFLRWFRQYATAIAPAFFKTFPRDPETLRSFLSVFPRFIWNRTPLPDNRFRPRPLPKPERNAPCTCGSGRKYKQCCATAEHADAAMPNLSMLPFVLDQLSAKRREALPYSYLSPEELAHVAETWMEEGREKDAAKLLEGLFADMTKLDERAEHAFDRLLDCYDRLNNPLKKKRMIEQGLNAPNKYLRAAAMQRQCCILSDRNEYAEAWKLFQELQRLIPNDSSLSHLEVVMLMGQGDKQRAAERARFWLARLSRDSADIDEALLAFLRSVAEGNAAEAITGIAREVNPSLDKLVDLVRNLPQPACHYKLNPMDDSAGPLVPDDKLRRLFAHWEVEAEYAADISDDLNWLEKNPLAWQSFEILDDWFATLEDYPALHGFEEIVLIPLLQHAETLLRKVIAQHHAEKLKLEWGWHENRPAMRLLSSLAMMLRNTKRFAEAVRVMEWMVLTLNPNDNQGMRDFLIHDYLRVGRVADAIALSKHYPDDMATIAYGTALALFMDKQVKAANAALKTAGTRYPEVRKMLLADKPKQPKINPEFVKVGGKDEAWFYRKDHLTIWQGSGGIEWLREQSGKPKHQSV